MKKDKSKKDKTKKDKKKKKKQSDIAELLETALVEEVEAALGKKDKKKKKNKKKDTAKAAPAKAKATEKLEKAKKTTGKSTQTIDEPKPEADVIAKPESEEKKSAAPKRAARKPAARKKTAAAKPPVRRAKPEAAPSLDEDAPTDITSLIAAASDTLYAFFSEPYVLEDGSTLSPAEARTLSFTCDQGGVTLTMIAADSGATKSAVTKPVNRLVAKNMLIRKPMPGNGREKLIVATDKGLSALEEMKVLKSKRLAKLAKLEATMDNAQIEVIKAYLQALFTL